MPFDYPIVTSVDGRKSRQRSFQFNVAQELICFSSVTGRCSELRRTELEKLQLQHESPIGRLTHPVVQISETPARWTRPAVPGGCHPYVAVMRVAARSS